MTEPESESYVVRCANNAVAFCAHHKNHTTVDGRAVMMMDTYLQTCRDLDANERTAALGIAFDTFRARVFA